jgi:hypothetical protein
MNDIIEEARAFFERAAQTEEARRVLLGHDEDYQFDLADGPSFHVSMQGGALSVQPGPTSRRGYYESTFIETDSRTLRELFSGKLGPVQAIEQRRFNMLIRMYEGCQITILLRIGGEQFREDLVQQAPLRA